ncbi:MAG: 1,4-dihydroxy-2-naphthoate polyprenyltransferase [Bdellovibrio sp.]|nr:MAG: 1,4-dihydroxy-2-naphthoate polyprenyltransferase [Bdellovibrio sp.]
MSSFKAWIWALRPKTLTASLVPVLVGSALPLVEGYEVNWRISFYALASALWIQIGTNLFNDVLDFKKGADNEERLGPVRVTQSGLLSPRQVMLGGILSFGFAIFFAIPLVLMAGQVILVIGVLSLLFGYLYTGGPFPLAYKGLGDLFVILFFGLVAVGGVYFLQTGTFHEDALIAGFQTGFLCTVLIAINNLRDIEQDRKVGKKTLAVRFGERFTKREILFLYVFSFILLPYWWQRGVWAAALFPLASLPLVFSLLKSLWATPPGVVYNQFLAKASLIYLLFGGLLFSGFMIS